MTGRLTRGVPTWLISLLCCTCCMWMLPGSSAVDAPVCNIEQSLRVNEVWAQCKGYNVGAMPLGIASSSLFYDFLQLGQDGDRVSLVRSTMSTYATCTNLAANTLHPSRTASGHMRPTPGTTTSLIRVLVSDSSAAAAAMQEGVYDVCFFETSRGTWRNTGIGIVVQNVLLGLEVLGLLHGNGTRPALPLNTEHPIEIRPKLPTGLVAADGDQITIIVVSAKCEDAPVVMPAVSVDERALASGHLNYSVANGAQFLGAHVLPGLFETWYQICFHRKGSGGFMKTGIGLHIQGSVAAVEVNGVMPNLGADVSLPPARRSHVTLHRIVPKLGYHQVLQDSRPLALFSFEDQNDSEMYDNHCGMTCGASDIFTSGFVEKGSRGRSFQPGLGTYKYMVCNGIDTHAYTLSNVTSPAMAMSLVFAMQWQPIEDGADQMQMQILAPYKTGLSDLKEGSVSVSIRDDPNTENSVVKYMRLQLQLTGYQDQLQGVRADTVLFNYPFEPGTWYFVALILDMRTDGVARLYVNGLPEPTLTKNKFEPQSLALYPAAEYLRMGPASIAAFYDGETLENVFNGFLDEVCMYEYKRVCICI